MRRAGLALTGVHPTETYVESATAAAAADLEVVWIAEDYFLRDSTTVAGRVAPHLGGADLGVFVNAYTRHPALTAMSVASLDEMIDGDVAVGMGAGTPSVLERVSAYDAPLWTVKEAIDALRATLAGEPDAYDGDRFRLDDVHLGTSPVLPFLGTFDGYSPEAAVYVAAKGPEMLTMAGDVGDGLLTPVGYTPGMVADAVDGVATGLARRDCDPDGFDVAGLLFYAPTANDRAREWAAIRVGVTADLDALHLDADRAALECVRRTYREDGPAAAAAEVPEAVVESLVLVGDADAACRRVDEYVAAGVDLPVLTHLGPADPSRTVAVAEAWTDGAY